MVNNDLGIFLAIEYNVSEFSEYVKMVNLAKLILVLLIREMLDFLPD